MAAESGETSGDGRVAVVTGGCEADGGAVALELAAYGFAVALVYLIDQPEAEAVVHDVIAAGGCAVAIRADVSDELDVARLFDETRAAFGRIDLLVHACGDGGAKNQPNGS